MEKIKMNRNYKHENLKELKLPFKIDSFTRTDYGFYAEYDGFHFEGKSIKAVVNQILKYIFVGGEE